MNAEVPVRGVALVTGAARGIGRASCVALARSGFDVACIDREDAAAAAGVVADVEAAGRRALHVEHDIADIDGHADVVAAAQTHLGAVTCLVNNAGVTSLVRGDPLALTPESFDRCMAVNLRGTFFFTQAVARVMVAAAEAEAQVHALKRYRSIVTISSANAEIVGLNRADYCITKAGLTMLSKVFAARLAAHGIHAFELRPGIIRTEMTEPATAKYERFIADDGVPLQRWGMPEDVGSAVAAIARGDLPFATGEVINVGGGLHLHRV